MRLVQITDIYDHVSCVNVDYIVDITTGYSSHDNMLKGKQCTVITMHNGSEYCINDSVQDIFKLFKEHGIST